MDDDEHVFACNPPYTHVTIGGAATCLCGAERFDLILAEMLLDAAIEVSA